MPFHLRGALKENELTATVMEKGKRTTDSIVATSNTNTLRHTGMVSVSTGLYENPFIAGGTLEQRLLVISIT